MNKQQAYNKFWKRFGVLAFEENSMPDDRTIEELISSGEVKSKYPYITYQVIVDDIGTAVYPTASIYDKSTSWETADKLANTISESLKATEIIKLDNGRMFITKGTPFAQHMREDGDATIRRIILNLGVEFFTE